MTTKRIAELPHHLDLAPENDVPEIKQNIGEQAQEFDGFFVSSNQGEYSEVWGYFGSVPFHSKTAYQVL